MFAKKKPANPAPAPPPAAVGELSTAAKTDGEFLEGKFQGIPEEKRRLMFVLPANPLVKIILIGSLVVFLLLAVFLTWQRAARPSPPTPPVVTGATPTPVIPEELLPTVSPSVSQPASASARKHDFRIEQEGDLGRVVYTDTDGETKILREHFPPVQPPLKELFLSPENGFIVISSGTSTTSSLEVIDLGSDATLATLSAYNRPVWLAEGKLVFNTPEPLNIPRPYEGGEGFSLATYLASDFGPKIIKPADDRNDYLLERVEKQEIYYKKVTASDPATWLKLTETHWRINFDGNIEEQIN